MDWDGLRTNAEENLRAYREWSNWTKQYKSFEKKSS
jgi:hypothetical protein